MKDGIDYFPLDVSLDDKFELIEAEFGLTGFGVIVKLFQYIYGGRGYYAEWTKEVQLLFARKIGAGGSCVSEIVSASIRRGIFDKELYDKYGILTSAGIQKRYFEAVKRRKSLKVEKRYLLVDYALISENACIFEENVSKNRENVNNFKQSRVKKSRVKESRVEDICAPDEIKQITDLFNKVCTSLPKAQNLSDERRHAIESISSVVKEQGGFKSFFERIEASDFLTGRKTKWKASFDWIIQPSNAVKIIEGNYDNAESPKRSASFDTDDFFDVAIKKSYDRGAL